MYHNDLPAEADAFGRLHADYPDAAPIDLTAYRAARTPRQAPRTIRRLVSERPFASFGRALGAQPTAATLTGTVRRLRAKSAMPRGAAVRRHVRDRAVRWFGRVETVCAIAIVVWVGAPVATAFAVGALR